MSESREATAVTATDVLDGIRRAWDADLSRHTTLSLDEPATLGVRAAEVRRVLSRQLITAHPLVEIVRAGLDDVVAHAEAFDRLAPQSTALLHSRQIEEYAAVFEFLLTHPERYNEFRWRWGASPTAHAIRNRHFNLKRPLDPSMDDWIRANAKELKDYIKITGTPAADPKRWTKYGSWLAPIPLSEIFEKTGRAESYSFTTYEWGSHSTHFSPLADRYEAFQFGDLTYVEKWSEFTRHQIHSLLRTLLPLAVDRDAVRSAHAALSAKVVHELVKSDVELAVKITNRHERWQMMMAEFLRTPHDPHLLRLALLGKTADDPLVVKV